MIMYMLLPLTVLFLSLVDPPDVVENVTLRMDLNHPQIWLKITWNKPSDLGSMRAISHYVMRWGKVSFPSNFFLAQAEYTHEPLNTTLANVNYILWNNLYIHIIIMMIIPYKVD